MPLITILLPFPFPSHLSTLFQQLEILRTKPDKGMTSDLHSTLVLHKATLNELPSDVSPASVQKHPSVFLHVSFIKIPKFSTFLGFVAANPTVFIPNGYFFIFL